ncbi:putative transposase [Burkholderia pseudomallei MSHR1043]|nr:putative transposase [Burkholderia pseudomallei MSHR1043]
MIPAWADEPVSEYRTHGCRAGPPGTRTVTRPEPIEGACTSKGPEDHLTASRRNPAIAAFHQRLIAGGKPRKLAWVACMRKLLTALNAVVKTGSSRDGSLHSARLARRLPKTQFELTNSAHGVHAGRFSR